MERILMAIVHWMESLFWGGILLREHLRRRKVVHYAYHQIGYHSLG